MTRNGNEHLRRYILYKLNLFCIFAPSAPLRKDDMNDRRKLLVSHNKNLPIHPLDSHSYALEARDYVLSVIHHDQEGGP